MASEITLEEALATASNKAPKFLFPGPPRPPPPQAVLEAVEACRKEPTREELEEWKHREGWGSHVVSGLGGENPATVVIPDAWDGSWSGQKKFGDEMFYFYNCANAIARGDLNLREGWTARAENIYDKRCIQWRCTKFYPMLEGCLSVQLELVNDDHPLFTSMLEAAHERMIETEKKYGKGFKEWMDAYNKIQAQNAKT